MTNLLQETLTALTRLNKTVDDVRWVGSPEYGYCTWDEFAQVADVEYDSGFGHQEVAVDLVVVGDDWWLERHEYDGAESWEFKSFPVKPEQHRLIDRVVGGWWDGLGEIEEDE